MGDVVGDLTLRPGDGHGDLTSRTADDIHHAARFYSPRAAPFRLRPRHPAIRFD